jgi:3-deoxy-D-manno-octulosonate 8-phosphate phosphatase (KDO 8-P phosphatase)
MIELIVFDVDGTLTNGQISYTSNKDEIKSFNVKDGLGINSWLRLGKKVAFITGRESKIVQRRAKELGINYVVQNAKDKLSFLKEIAKKESIELKNIAVIGDDLNDLAMLKACGWSFCPSDANGTIRSSVKTVLENKGGEGAAREMIDMIIKSESLEKELLKLWL